MYLDSVNCRHTKNFWNYLMDTIEIKIQLPREFSKAIPDLSKYTFEKLVLGLYLDGEISFGKAAQMLKLTQDQFIQYLGKKNIPYFHQEPEEIKKELERLKGLK